MFDKTAFVIGEGGKGSARAIDGFNVGDSIISARNQGILISGGGHSAAGGVGLSADKLPVFKAYMEKEAEGFQRPALPVDWEADCGTINPDFVRSFEMLALSGQGNTLPRVAIAVDTSAVHMMKGKHIKAWIKGDAGTQEIIVFNAMDTPKGEAI